MIQKENAFGYSLESKAYRLWDPKAKRVLKSRDVKFLDKFQINEDETLDTFINVEVITNLFTKENLPIEEEEETTEDFSSAEEDIINECFEDDTDESDENKNSGILPVTRSGRGRPKII